MKMMHSKYMLLIGLLAAINATTAETVRLSCHTEDDWNKSSENNVQPGTIISFPGDDWTRTLTGGNKIKSVGEEVDKEFLNVDLGSNGYWWLDKPEKEVFDAALAICKTVEGKRPYPILFKEGIGAGSSGYGKVYKFFKKVPLN